MIKCRKFLSCQPSSSIPYFLRLILCLKFVFSSSMFYLLSPLCTYCFNFIHFISSLHSQPPLYTPPTPLRPQPPLCISVLHNTLSASNLHCCLHSVYFALPTSIFPSLPLIYGFCLHSELCAFTMNSLPSIWIRCLHSGPSAFTFELSFHFTPLNSCVV